MSDSAHVTSIDALQDWKNALAGFRDAAGDALVTVTLEFRKMFDWLEDQRKLWEGEIRRREEQVTHAKAELWRRKMLPVVGKHPDTTEQEKALRKAQRRLEEAQEKLENCRRWVPLLRRAVEEYEGPGRRLSAWLDGDLPRALARLAQQLGALEAYVSMSGAPMAKPQAGQPDAEGQTE
jgi:DNA repair exonuclease SbcCD ATPase subunit